MSVEITVALDTGATMGFVRDDAGLRTSTPQRALAELDKGYNMIRDWLVSQMPPDLSKPTAAMPEPERRVSSRRPAVVDVNELR